MRRMVRNKLVKSIVLYMFITLIANFVFRIEWMQWDMVRSSEIVFHEIEHILEDHMIELNLSDEDTYSHVFSLFEEKGSALYAMKPETYEVIGATNRKNVGKTIFELGVSEKKMESGKREFHTFMGRRLYYLIMREQDGVLFAKRYDVAPLYGSMEKSNLIVATYLTLIAVVMILDILKYLDHRIIRGIADVNSKLQSITDGNMDTKVEVNTTPEFTKLSSHINEMVKSILETNDKLSSVLDVSKVPIGIYEYTIGSKRMKITGKMAEILRMSEEEAKALFADQVKFALKLEEIKENQVEKEKDVFRLPCEEEGYVQINSYVRNNNIMGILIDVTVETKEKIRIRRERDEDSLTGLYNRRAFGRIAKSYLKDEDKLGNAAFVMIDTDNLKKINDNYGHEAGDCYLKGMADVLRSVSAPNKLTAHVSGDEFAVLIYGCESRERLQSYLEELEAWQDGRKIICSRNQEEYPLHFSMGTAFVHEDGDVYENLLKAADQRMYERKRRKYQERREE